MTMKAEKSRPARYFLMVVNRGKLEKALEDVDNFDIWDCLDEMDCKSLQDARKKAAQYKPKGTIWERTDIRPSAWDWDCEELE